MPSTIKFLFSNHNRTVTDWRNVNPRYSAVTNARRHAKKHGIAGMWRADESFLLLYDAGRIRQKTFKHAVPIGSWPRT